MQDTREKIEADVLEWASTRLLGDGVAETVIGWLDRQDAITERDCRSASEPYEDAAARTIGDLRAALEETTRKRGRLQDEADELQATVDKLKQELAERNGAVCERDGRINAYERRNTELNDALKAICNHYGVSTQWAAEDAAKKLFESIDSTHMRLPVDADGVTWHIGDKVQRRGNKERPNIVTGFQFYSDGNHKLHVQEDDCIAWVPFASECRHVKQDTVESLLDELLEEANCKVNEDGSCEMGVSYARRTEYAERIRKAVEHDRD